MPILIYTVFVSLLYAVIESNIGTFYRKKAQVLPFFFMMAAVGLAYVDAKRKNIPLEYLFSPNQRKNMD